MAVQPVMECPGTPYGNKDGFMDRSLCISKIEMA